MIVGGRNLDSVFLILYDSFENLALVPRDFFGTVDISTDLLSNSADLEDFAALSLLMRRCVFVCVVFVLRSVLVLGLVVFLHLQEILLMEYIHTYYSYA